MRGERKTREGEREESGEFELERKRKERFVI